jgi:O-antigen ligase
MSSISPFPKSAISTIRSKVTAYPAIFIIAGSGLAVLIAYLVATGNWLVGIGLLLALPAFVLLHKYPWLALLIWLVVVPLVTVTSAAPERRIYWIVHRALPPITVIIMLVSSILRIHTRRIHKLGWPELAMAGYLFVSLVSIALIDDNPLAVFFQFYDRVISPMCLYLIIRLWSPSEVDLRRLVPVTFFVVISQISIGLLAWYTPQVLPSAWIDDELRTVGSLKSYGAYAVTMIFSGLYLLHAALNRRAGLVRSLYMLSFLLAAYGVFMTFSRGAWVAGGLVLVGLFYIYFRHIVRVGIVVIPVIILLAGSVLADQTDWAKERLYSERSEESALVRLPVYQASLRMLAAKPAFGWGYENFNRYDWQFYSPVEGVAAPIRDISSHNFYLQMLAEQGLVGTLFFLFPLFWWLMRSIKTLPRLPAEGFLSRKMLILFWLFFLAYMTINMFHNMRIPFGLGLWWGALALIASVIERHQGFGASETAPRTHP